MNITLDGQAHELAEGTTVHQLVSQVTGKELDDASRPTDGSRLGLAVAVGGAVVPRSQWSQTTLSKATTIEIVTAAQGG